jgi:hypothetical protein
MESIPVARIKIEQSVPGILLIKMPPGGELKKQDKIGPMPLSGKSQAWRVLTYRYSLSLPAPWPQETEKEGMAYQQAFGRSGL